MQSVQTVYETDREVFAYESRRGPAAGIVFLPCAICLAPVDLAVARRYDGPPTCEGHRASDGIRLS